METSFPPNFHVSRCQNCQLVPWTESLRVTSARSRLKETERHSEFAFHGFVSTWVIPKTLIVISPQRIAFFTTFAYLCSRQSSATYYVTQSVARSVVSQVFTPSIYIGGFPSLASCLLSHYWPRAHCIGKMNIFSSFLLSPDPNYASGQACTLSSFSPAYWNTAVKYFHYCYHCY